MIHYAAITRPKLGKQSNEDCLLLNGKLVQKSRAVMSCQLKQSDKKVRFAIADGVGSLPAAARASYQLLKTLNQIDQDHNHLTPAETAEQLRDQIVQTAMSNRTLENAATTLATAEISEDEVCLWHVGDSRIYLWETCGLKQLTKDHTVLQTMVDTGEVEHDEAKKIGGSKTYQALDQCFVFAPLTDTPLVSSLTINIENSLLLMASDGLHQHLSRDEIHQSINPSDLKESVKRLSNLCELRGGSDDVSLILLNVS